jgi:hypothetical protein
VFAELHFNMCREIGVKLDSGRWHVLTAKLVETGPESEVTILRSQQVQTDRTISNNKPDVIIRDNEKGTYIC